MAPMAGPASSTRWKRANYRPPNLNCRAVYYRLFPFRNLDLRSRGRAHFPYPLDRSFSQSTKNLGMRVLSAAPGDWVSRIAAGAHRRIERQSAQEIHLHLAGCSLAAARTEDIDTLAAVRAHQITHVLHDS